ncbi:MAG: hypothetical protein H6999_12120 [Hahellaceae bacterium]|nr:hypothetical protein [Hahellaceae bacterium]MCP5170488.1 hypothetical protein [Hahellaceae bacterium]
MPTKPHHEEHEELSEEQRLTLLEKSVTMNKFVLLGIALTLIIGISVAITTAIVTGLSTDEAKVEPAAFIALQQEVVALKQQLTTQLVANETLQKDITQLKTTIKNSSAPAFQRLLLQQEGSIQEFLKNMKSGMYDLSRMVPGSRTWLDLYNEQMSKAISESEQRERELKKIQTGAKVSDIEF